MTLWVECDDAWLENLPILQRQGCSEQEIEEAYKAHLRSWLAHFEGTEEARQQEILTAGPVQRARLRHELKVDRERAAQRRRIIAGEAILPSLQATAANSEAPAGLPVQVQPSPSDPQAAVVPKSRGHRKSRAKALAPAHDTMAFHCPRCHDAYETRAEWFEHVNQAHRNRAKSENAGPQLGVRPPRRDKEASVFVAVVRGRRMIVVNALGDRETLRLTHCWRCREPLSSEINDLCGSCRGLICSSGHCLCGVNGIFRALRK